MFQSNLDKVLSAFSGTEEKALTLIGNEWSRTASALAPVDTHRLKQSVDMVVNKSEHSVSVGTPIDYGLYQEVGTRKMKAHPYIRPGIMNIIGKIKAIMEAAYSGLDR